MKETSIFSFHYNSHWTSEHHKLEIWGEYQVNLLFQIMNGKKKLKSDAMAELWIDKQMAKRSCVVVLIGKHRWT